MSSALALVIVLFGLALMIMLHELGHLIVAKVCGMKVSQYFVGFGPRLWSVTRGETEYGVRAIPAGGFVKIPGMSDLEEIDEADEVRTYRQASFPRKIAVVSAGSVVHFILALSMLWLLFSFIGMPSSALTLIGQHSNVAGQIAVVQLHPLHSGADPARAAGIRPGDLIVSVDGRAITSENALVAAIEHRAGERVPMVLERNGRDVRVTITPAVVKGVGMIGVEISPANTTVTVSPLAAVPDSFRWIGSYVSTAAGSIGGEFEDAWRSLTNPSVKASSAVNENRPMSIVGAARIATQAAEQGAQQVLIIFVILNIFIGIFNMLPIPVLDGGHVAMAIYERVRSRRGRPLYHASYAKLVPVMYAFVAILVVLGGSLVYLDIVKPIPSPFG